MLQGITFTIIIISIFLFASVRNCYGQKVKTNDNEISDLPSSKIAFVSKRDGNSEIYTINPDGTQLTRLTIDSADDTSPFWSPDGFLIGFFSAINDSSEINVMKQDGTEIRRLVKLKGQANMGSWSPDGKQIIFTLSNNLKLEICLINSDGSNLKSIKEGMAPAWNPNGKQLVFNKGNMPQIYYMDIDGSNEKIFFQNKSTFSVDLLPVWSADGNNILFTRISAGDDNAKMKHEIYTVDNSAQNLKRLTDFKVTGRVFSGNWSPDNKKIVLVSEKDGNEEIYIMNSDGTSASRLTDHPEHDTQPSWSPVLLKSK